MAAGCIRDHPPPPISLGDIADEIDTNSARVTSLQGKVGVSVRAPGEKVFVSCGGRLNFEQPSRLHLQISRYGRREFSLGSDGKRYWFWSREGLFGREPNTLLTGSVAKIERASAKGLILRPDIVADALGVGPIRSTRPDLAILPERYKDAYVLNYVRVVERRLRLTKKVYLDPFKGRMTRVDYFALGGSRVLTATFDGEWTRNNIRVVRRVTLEMPVDDAAVRFDLRQLKLNKKLATEAFDTPEFPGAKHIDLDKDP